MRLDAGIRAIQGRWRSMSLVGKWASLLAGFLLASFIALRVFEWWTEWPSRLILPTPKHSRPWAYSPDGEILVTESWDEPRELAFWDPEDGRKRASLLDGDARFRFRGMFSPDGRSYAAPWSLNTIGRNFSIDLVDVASAQVRWTFESPDCGFLGIGFEDGGATVRLISTDATQSTLRTTEVDAATGQGRPTRTLACPMSRSFIAVSHDGRYLATAPMAIAATGPTDVLVWDLDEDREAAKLPPIPARMITHAITFSPDGRTLALGLEDGTIQLWDLASRRLRSTLPCPRENYSPMILAFSPDGSTLGSFNHFTRRVASLDLARMLIASHLGDQDHVMQTELVLLDVATGRPMIRSRSNGPTVFAPDGRSVATSHDDGRVRIRDLPPRPAQAEAR